MENNNFLNAIRFESFNFKGLTKKKVILENKEYFNAHNVLIGLEHILEQKLTYEDGILDYLDFLATVNEHLEENEDYMFLTKIIRDLIFERDIEEVIADFKIYLDNKDKPLKERELTYAGKEMYCKYYYETKKFDENYDVDLFKKYIFELANSGNIEIKEILAYLYYGDNLEFGFECDYSKTVEILNELMANKEVYESTIGMYANTLGYIYYYGRVDGKRDYEKAFKYFTIGSSLNYYESTYKLADMFEHGYYVDKNGKAAMSLVTRYFDQLEKEFKEENFDTNFADLLIRMGNYNLKGVGCDVDELTGYIHLYLAKKVLELRMEYNPHIGDDYLLKKLESQLNNLEYNYVIDKNRKTANFTNIYAFREFFSNDSCTIIQKELKNEYKFTFISNENVMVVNPFYDYFNLTNKIDVYVKKEDVVRTNLNDEKEYIMDTISQDLTKKRIFNDEYYIELKPDTKFKVKK